MKPATQALARFALGPLLALTSITACTLVTDVGRFKKDQAAAQRNFDDLKLTVMGMNSHVSEKVEFRVIDANNIIQMRGFLDTLGDVRATVVVPAAIPRVNAPYRLDFFADHNASGGYETIPDDHAWRVEPLEDYGEPTSNPNDGVVTVLYPHSYSFTELNEHPKGTRNPPKDTTAPAVLRFSGMTGYIGKLLQVRVFDAETHHAVGLYRVTKIALDAFDLTLPGVIDGGVQYSLELYVDANGNGTYESPAAGGAAADHGWRIPRPSDDSGLTLDFNPGRFPERNIDVGAP